MTFITGCAAGAITVLIIQGLILLWALCAASDELHADADASTPGGVAPGNAALPSPYVEQVGYNGW